MDAVSHRYSTPLGEACWSNRFDIAQFLLQQGADPNLAESFDGKTPLMEAVYRGNRELINLLIEAGANVEAKLEVAHHVYMDVPDFAIEAANKKLAIEMRSLINRQRRAEDGFRVLLREVSAQT